MIKTIRNLAVAAAFVLLPALAFGQTENDLDLRLKYGMAAQADEVSIAGIGSGSIGGEPSSNAQIELLYSYYFTPEVSGILGAGYFSRKHSGSENIGVGNGNTTFDYDAQGYSITAGVGFKTSENLRWEGRFELGTGDGKTKLSTSGVNWNKTDSGSYQSQTFIAGGYYSFAKPGIELGLEIGSQSFTGDWKIWNNNGYWADSTVKGNSVIANVVLGYRF